MDSSLRWLNGPWNELPRVFSRCRQLRFYFDVDDKRCARCVCVCARVRQACTEMTLAAIYQVVHYCFVYIHYKFHIIMHHGKCRTNVLWHHYIKCLFLYINEWVFYHFLLALLQQFTWMFSLLPWSVACFLTSRWHHTHGDCEMSLNYQATLIHASAPTCVRARACISRERSVKLRRRLHLGINYESTDALQKNPRSQQ